jgi:hypothetical protein
MHVRNGSQLFTLLLLSGFYLADNDLFHYDTHFLHLNSNWTNLDQHI